MNQPLPNQPQAPEEEQLTLFGDGDHGDLTPEQVPVVDTYFEEPGGILIERDREVYP